MAELFTFEPQIRFLGEERNGGVQMAQRSEYRNRKSGMRSKASQKQVTCLVDFEMWCGGYA